MKSIIALIVMCLILPLCGIITMHRDTPPVYAVYVHWNDYIKDYAVISDTARYWDSINSIGFTPKYLKELRENTIIHKIQ